MGVAPLRANLSHPCTPCIRRELDSQHTENGYVRRWVLRYGRPALWSPSQRSQLTNEGLFPAETTQPALALRQITVVDNNGSPYNPWFHVKIK